MQHLRWRERAEALAEGAIADLIVILDEGHEGGRWQVLTGLAARSAPIRHVLALEGEALRQRARQLLRLLVPVVGVIALGFPARCHMQHVMYVIVPLPIVGDRMARGVAAQPACLVVLVLQHQVHLAA